MSKVVRAARQADYPHVSKAEDLSTFEVADLADRFIGHVEGFLSRDPKIAPIVILGAEPDPQADLRRADEHRRERARQCIMRDGSVLAEALLRFRLSASFLLKLLHRVDTSTQREISTIWEDVKVSLQEAILQLRKNDSIVAPKGLDQVETSSTQPTSTKPPSGEAENDIAEFGISPRALKAGKQYDKAVEALKKVNPNPTDIEAYQLISAIYKKNAEQQGEPFEFPIFATWSRNLRLWRNLTGQQRNTPREGRGDESGSVVQSSEI